MGNIRYTYQIHDVVREIEDTERSQRVVAVWGASGSGKTFFSRALSESIPDSRVINIDNYLSESVINGEYCSDNRYDDCIEGINPRIWDHERLNNDLISALDGSEICVPQFDHQKRSRKKDSVKLGQASLTIIEGAYAYNNKIVEHIDKLVLVDAPLHDRFMRKLVRLLHRTQRKDVDESIQRYLKRTQPSLEKYWSEYLLHADIIYNNCFHPWLNVSDLSLPLVDDDFISDIKIMPKKGYGALLPEESLGISREIDKANLKYSIGRLAVINCMIEYKSLDAILEYYDEQK